MNQPTYNYGYICNVYTKSYNVFVINAGTGIMKYS